MNIPLDIQLEFLDYKIGHFIKKYGGNYTGTYNKKILLIYTFSNMANIKDFTNVSKYIKKIKETNSLYNEYNVPTKGELLFLLDDDDLYISEYNRFNNYFIITKDRFYDYNNDVFEKLSNLDLTYTKNVILRILLVRSL